MRIRCQDLYDAVWEKPVRTLAKEWGLSDVGLAKVCRKFGIPLPGLGHWAKAAVGRGFPKPPLIGDPDVEISFSGAPSLRQPKLSETTKQKLAPALEAASYMSTTDEPPALARWTKKTARALDKKADSGGFISTKQGTFRVSVSESSKERAIRLLNILETTLSAAGMAWEITQEGQHVVGKMLNETIPFELTERYTRTEHVEKHPTYSWQDQRTYSYQFTGDLTIRIGGWYEGRKSWSDGKTKRLEEKLPEVIEGFLAAAEAMRQRTIANEEQKKLWAEEAKLRGERERIAREEKAFLDATIKEVNDWVQANTIRQYAAELRKLIAEHNIELTEAGEEWLSRVERSADQIDSARKRLSL